MLNAESLNHVDNIYTDGGKSIIDIQELPYYDGEQYDLNDSKSFTKYMKDLEFIVRNSFEYRQFIAFLRNVEGMNECAVLNNVSNRADAKVRIEIHHSPFTLYDICHTVYKKRCGQKEDININSVAEEVLYLHYISWVGLIPLSATVHDMVHNGYVFIPIDKVRGYYRKFIESYYNYIDPDLLDAVDAAEQATKDHEEEKRLELFNSHRMYVNANGSYELPEKTRIRGDIRNRIDSIKNNSSVNKVMCVIAPKGETSK